MAGRPRGPFLTQAGIEAHIFDRLRAGDGPIQRNNHRESIRPTPTAAQLDAAITALAAAGKILAEHVQKAWLSHHGIPYPYWVTVYSLPARGRRKPTPVPERTKTGRPVVPLPDGADLEEKILVALRAAGASLIRSQLRYAIGRRIRTEPFEASITRLVARDAITVKETIKDAAPGYTPRHISTTYSIKERRERSI